MIMHLGMIIWILILHYIGDWVCQTREQAENKWRIGSHMLTHISTYFIVLFLGMVWAFAPEATSPTIDIWIKMVLGWSALNAVAHFTVDAITSNQTKHFWNDGKPSKGFWNWIGFDQLCHAVILFGTYAWLMS